MADITKFPITGEKRWMNQKGKNAICCTVSMRYLSFDEVQKRNPHGTQVTINVMTDTDDEKKDHKLCEIIVTLEELERMVDQLKNKADK